MVDLQLLLCTSLRSDPRAGIALTETCHFSPEKDDQREVLPGGSLPAARCPPRARGRLWAADGARGAASPLCRGGRTRAGLLPGPGHPAASPRQPGVKPTARSQPGGFPRREQPPETRTGQEAPIMLPPGSNARPGGGSFSPASGAAPLRPTEAATKGCRRPRGRRRPVPARRLLAPRRQVARPRGEAASPRRDGCVSAIFGGGRAARAVQPAASPLRLERPLLAVRKPLERLVMTHHTGGSYRRYFWSSHFWCGARVAPFGAFYFQFLTAFSESRLRHQVVSSWRGIFVPREAWPGEQLKWGRRGAPAERGAA
ncbi:uncharacterized protein [Struthio camelus]|uniref:uncharacterized protein n=1 Tax=Struthio camelus TaxID=8801 RepID=UPI003603E21F